MATATITFTDGEVDGVVHISVSYGPGLDIDSAAHELVTEIAADLQDAQTGGLND